jgi:hypothetical protein
MAKVRAGWAPNMERRSAFEDQQTKCLIASAGHEWMVGYFDRLPAAVRRRLASSHHNVCAACFTQEAERVASTRHLKRPTQTIFFEVLKAIEAKLDAALNQ